MLKLAVALFALILSAPVNAGDVLCNDPPERPPDQSQMNLWLIGPDGNYRNNQTPACENSCVSGARSNRLDFKVPGSWWVPYNGYRVEADNWTFFILNEDNPVGEIQARCCSTVTGRCSIPRLVFLAPTGSRPGQPFFLAKE